jgi:hypothetical protein
MVVALPLSTARRRRVAIASVASLLVLLDRADQPLPTWVGKLILTWAPRRRSPLLAFFLPTPPLAALSSIPLPDIVLTVNCQHHPSSSPSKSGKRSISMPSSSSNPSVPEPTTNEAGQPTSLHHCLPCATPPSTAIFHRSPVEPRVPQAAHGSAIRPRPNLHRR